jgi:hypothetical protein
VAKIEFMGTVPRKREIISSTDLEKAVETLVQKLVEEGVLKI